jgi:hypothetical protein
MVRRGTAGAVREGRHVEADAAARDSPPDVSFCATPLGSTVAAGQALPIGHSPGTRPLDARNQEGPDKGPRAFWTRGASRRNDGMSGAAQPDDAGGRVVQHVRAQLDPDASRPRGAITVPWVCGGGTCRPLHAPRRSCSYSVRDRVSSYPATADTPRFPGRFLADRGSPFQSCDRVAP